MTGELRGVWENIDPAILTEVADRVAEIAPVENQVSHQVLLFVDITPGGIST